MSNEEFINSITTDREIWRDVKGFEGKYMVSSLGRVVSLSYPITSGRLHYCRRQHFMTVSKQINGYMAVGLSIGDNKNKTVKVHRIVAEAFLPNEQNLPVINHKDEDKTNNTVFINKDGSVNEEKSNLEWCSIKYNVNYGTGTTRRRQTFLTNYINCKKVARLDKNGQIEKVYDGLIHAAKEIGRHYSAISFSIKHGGRCAGYHWTFL